MRYIEMNGQNVSIGSTGTRLLLTILGTCLDTRFGTLLIDEPELGLGPKIQNALSRFFQDAEEREKYFPHIDEIYIATHSGLFLSRSDIRDNFYMYQRKATL
jgi:predicted ATP-dependent endonuclease of OLD family